MAASTLKKIDIIVYGLLLLGALNWGFVGLFGFNLVATIFGELSVFTRLVYCIFGFAAIYDLVAIKSIWKRWNIHYRTPARA